MFKPELWQNHDEYRTLVTTVGCRLSRNNPKYSFDLYTKERDKLLNLNLDPLLDLIPGFYSDDIMAGKPISDDTQETLQKIFSILAVLPSLQAGLFDAADLTISGDGTAVASHSSPYGRHLSSCSRSCPFRSTCRRHYSDPDAGWGWDSDNETWFFGHTLYMLCCRNSKLKVELPLLMNFTDARRHDSKNFLYAIDGFGRNGCGLSPKNICLDSAHDNISTYKLLEHWDINALIDINGRTKSSAGAADDITLNKEGHSLCRAGHEMKCVPGAMIP